MSNETKCPDCGEIIKYIANSRTGDIIPCENETSKLMTDAGRLVYGRVIHSCGETEKSNDGDSQANSKLIGGGKIERN